MSSEQPNGSGKPRQRRPKGDGHLFQRDGFWHIAYTVNYRKVRESSHSRSRTVASDLLRERLRQVREGTFVSGGSRITLGHLRDLIEADYLRNERRTAKRVGQLFANLISHLPGGENMKAERIPHEIAGYITARKEKDGAANGTVNRELAVLRRALKLAKLYSLIHSIEHLQEAPPRGGFLNRPELDRLLPHLPERLRDPVLLMWCTGMRAREALRLEWRNVKELEHEIRLEADDTKTRTARTIPFAGHPDVAGIIARRRALTDAWQREHGEVIPWVFWYARSRGALRKGGIRKAAPVREYARQWVDACDKAGLHGRLVHDLRRSFAKEAKRRGTDDKVVMALGGWKTRCMLDRYNIIDATDLNEAMRKLGGGEQGQVTRTNSSGHKAGGRR